MREKLQAELAQAVAELKAHMATWEYAFAMGGSCHGGANHPVHWCTRAHTEQLHGPLQRAPRSAGRARALADLDRRVRTAMGRAPSS